MPIPRIATPLPYGHLVVVSGRMCRHRSCVPVGVGVFADDPIEALGIPGGATWLGRPDSLVEIGAIAHLDSPQS